MLIIASRNQYNCSIRDSHLGHCFDHFLPGQLSLTKSAARSQMSFGLWWWMIIIYGISVSIIHILSSNDDLSWRLMLLLWLSTFIGFIIIIILTWMGPLMYIYDGHMVYEYSFLVDLDILSPLMHSVFSVKNLH